MSERKRNMYLIIFILLCIIIFYAIREKRDGEKSERFMLSQASFEKMNDMIANDFEYNAVYTDTVMSNNIKSKAVYYIRQNGDISASNGSGTNWYPNRLEMDENDLNIIVNYLPYGFECIYATEEQNIYTYRLGAEYLIYTKYNNQPNYDFLDGLQFSKYKLTKNWYHVKLLFR